MFLLVKWRVLFCITSICEFSSYLVVDINVYPQIKKHILHLEILTDFLTMPNGLKSD